jgi:hypothetical protein
LRKLHAGLAHFLRVRFARPTETLLCHCPILAGHLHDENILSAKLRQILLRVSVYRVTYVKVIHNISTAIWVAPLTDFGCVQRRFLPLRWEVVEGEGMRLAQAAHAICLWLTGRAK